MVHFTHSTNKPHDWEDICVICLIDLLILIITYYFIYSSNKDDTLECIACSRQTNVSRKYKQSIPGFEFLFLIGQKLEETL